MGLISRVSSRTYRSKEMYDKDPDAMDVDDSFDHSPVMSHETILNQKTAFATEMNASLMDEFIKNPDEKGQANSLISKIYPDPSENFPPDSTMASTVANSYFTSFSKPFDASTRVSVRNRKPLSEVNGSRQTNLNTSLDSEATGLSGTSTSVSTKLTEMTDFSKLSCSTTTSMAVMKKKTKDNKWYFWLGVIGIIEL